MSTDINVAKVQVSNIIQSGGFLGSTLSKLAGPLKKAAVSWAKTILAPLVITAAASATDAGTQKKKKIHGSATTTLIIPNKEMNDIMEIVQALDDSNILLKGVAKTIKNETKEKKVGFLSKLFGTLGASVLGNILAEKGIVRAGSGNRKGKGIVRGGSGKRIVRAGYGKKMGFLIPSHPSTNFEIQRYYQHEAKFNGVYSRNNLPKKIKDVD